VANVMPSGGQGIGVNPRGSNYPFVDPSPDVAHILADAYLAYDRETALPLRITRLTGFSAAFLGDDVRCDVVVRDAVDAVVFDSTTATRYHSVLFGPRLKIHEWYTATAVLRVVQHTAFPDAQSVVAIPDPIVPQNGVLDARVGTVLPTRVLSFRDQGSGLVVTGDVVFANGYNTTMTVTEATRGARLITQLTWAAEPASGLGRYPGCAEPDLVMRTINRINPNEDGDFQLGAAGCYWVRQPTTLTGHPQVSLPLPATLHLGSDCGPCCECDDFVRVQKGILRTWNRFVAIGRNAEDVRDVFGDIVDRWQQEKECVEARIVTATLAPFGDEYVEVVVSICNHTRLCLYDTTLTLSVTESPGRGQIPSGATQISAVGKGMMPYQMTGAWPTYVAYFDSIQAMTSGLLRTRFRFPNARSGTVVTLHASAAPALPLRGLQLPQSTTQSATFGA
jgi:hypothetical protein